MEETSQFTEAKRKSIGQNLTNISIKDSTFSKKRKSSKSNNKFKDKRKSDVSAKRMSEFRKIRKRHQMDLKNVQSERSPISAVRSTSQRSFLDVSAKSKKDKTPLKQNQN